jgi:hypothetical protein
MEGRGGSKGGRKSQRSLLRFAGLARAQHTGRESGADGKQCGSRRYTTEHGCASINHKAPAMRFLPDWPRTGGAHEGGLGEDEGGGEG